MPKTRARCVLRRTLLEVLGGGVNELERNELEAALLEAGDDGADEAALDAVGLIGGKGAKISVRSCASTKSVCSP